MNPKTRNIERVVINECDNVINKTMKDLMGKDTTNRKERYGRNDDDINVEEENLMMM